MKESFKSTKILTPTEYEQMRYVMKKRFKILFDVALFTGMRYVELQLFSEHPEWYKSELNYIKLPKYAETKAKRAKTGGRNIWLSTLGNRVIQDYVETKNRPKFPKWPQSWSQNLERWSKKADIDLDDENITAKTTRKTWESWLAFYYPEKHIAICMSQGHTETTSMKHYLNLVFSEEEKNKMAQYVMGWLK